MPGTFAGQSQHAKEKKRHEPIRTWGKNVQPRKRATGAKSWGTRNRGQPRQKCVIQVSV